MYAGQVDSQEFEIDLLVRMSDDDEVVVGLTSAGLAEARAKAFEQMRNRIQFAAEVMVVGGLHRFDAWSYIGDRSGSGNNAPGSGRQ
jgi:hypothetical protein